jgi:hypothetical protein
MHHGHGQIDRGYAGSKAKLYIITVVKQTMDFKTAEFHLLPDWLTMDK